MTYAQTRHRGARPAALGLAAALGSLLFAAARPAQAWPEYPQSVADSLHLATAPACTLCHTTNQGGPGTATKPFARTVQQLGVGATEDPGSLLSALDQVQACQTDSDGDGISDVDEITHHGDPNDGHGTPTSQCGDVYTGPLAQTGCVVRPGTQGAPFQWLAAFGALSVALSAVRRRRARRSAAAR